MLISHASAIAVAAATTAAAAAAETAAARGQLASCIAWHAP